MRPPAETPISSVSVDFSVSYVVRPPPRNPPSNMFSTLPGSMGRESGKSVLGKQSPIFREIRAAFLETKKIPSGTPPEGLTAVLAGVQSASLLIRNFSRCSGKLSPLHRRKQEL